MKKNNVLTHESVSKLTIWAMQNKGQLQASIDSGKPIYQIAEEKGCHPQAMRKILASVGIQCGHEKKTPSSLHLDAITAVVIMLAKGLNVPHDELLPFIK